MGWVFGGIWVRFDFRTMLSEARREEREALIDPLRLRDVPEQDAGLIALEALEMSASPADAPISLGDATRSDMGDLAVGFAHDCTLVHGHQVGLCEPWEELDRDPDVFAAYKKVSARWGDVLVFWCDDRGDSYAFAWLRGGALLRAWARGTGLRVDFGEPLACEPREPAFPHDDLMVVLERFLGAPLLTVEMLSLEMERFMR